MNMMVYRVGHDCLVVDAGMMFPRESGLGIDRIIPRMTFLETCGTLHGVVLTHGHEDHIGALPYLLSLRDVPVYCGPLTRELCRARLAEHGDVARARIDRLPDDETLRLGPFAIRALDTAHSIPQTRMLAIDTPAGLVVHTGDFKLDPDPPDGRPTDRQALEGLGRQGVLALLSDSTNALLDGTTPPEASVRPAFDRLLAESSGRVVVTTFASNLERVAGLARAAVSHGRRLALTGGSLTAHVEAGLRVGCIRFPGSARLSTEQVMNLPRRQALIVATGSQGESRSAMARIAEGQHREVALDPGDCVAHSARIIPGAEVRIGEMINRLLERGVEVVTSGEAAVHVSGHPSRDELRRVIELLRPRYFVPIHGEYRQLQAHARLAETTGIPAERICLARDGDCLVLDDTGILVAERVPAGRVYVDGTLEAVEGEVLNDRRRLAAGGVLIPVLRVDGDRRLVGLPEIVTRGVPADGSDSSWLRLARRVVEDLVASSPVTGDGSRAPEAKEQYPVDLETLKDNVRTELRRALRRRGRRRPLICPIIEERR